MNFISFKNNYFKLIIIVLISFLFDYLFFIDTYPPGWDQGYHLSNLFKMSNIISDDNINFFEKFDNLLNVTDNYRGPLTYLVSSFPLIIFKNNSYTSAYLSNHIFNFFICILIYEIGKTFKNNSIGIYAVIIFTFSPFIIMQRTDYLIDLSLTCFFCLSIITFLKWLNSKENFSKYSILSGLSVGFIFLVKPTSIIFLLMPIIYLLIFKFRNIEKKKLYLIEISLFFVSFILIIFPWFSRHWLTIITSTLNAWKWGINYQDGLDAFSFEGWIFYIKKLPEILGFFNIFNIVILFIIKILTKNVNFIFKKNINKNELLFFVFLLNFYLVISLMSTKDLRFFMPIFPIVCIYLSRLVITGYFPRNYQIFRQTLILSTITISLIINNTNGFKHLANNKKDYIKNYWPHNEVIKSIEEVNPYLFSTLAVLPDTREINTFNLEAEAARLGEKIAVRQIVSNEKTYKDDLKYFDWFLVKSDNQGIMTNKSKKLLNKYLLNNNSFEIYKDWNLPDKSSLKLIKRIDLSNSVKETSCKTSFPSVDYKMINKGLNIKLKGQGTDIYASNLLINLQDKNNENILDISINNGVFNTNFKSDKCYELNQNIPINNKEYFSNSNLTYRTILMTQSKRLLSLKDKFVYDEPNQFENKNYNPILMENKIDKVSLLGNLLRKGNFDQIFNIVGVLNQSDPKQSYLRSSEAIFQQRYADRLNINDLYSVLISQILQKKIYSANNTIGEILKYDNKNGNAHLVSAIINIYLFNVKDAKQAINYSKINKISDESNEILNIADGLVNLLELKLIKAYEILS